MPEVLQVLTPADLNVAETTVTTPATPAESTGTRYYSLELPSLGRIGYPRNVEYRDIMVRDEKILASATDKNYIQVLHKILKSLLKDQSFFNSLTIHDRDFLLLWVWANNYSSLKKVPVTCPMCEFKVEKEIDLTKLPVAEISSEVKNPTRMTLDGKVIDISLITIGIQEQASTFCKDHPDYDFETVALSLTMSIEGRPMPAEMKVRWIEENIRGKDMAMVRGFHEHYKYGVDEQIEHTCTACGEVSQVRVPFQPQWLRPSLSFDNRAIVQPDA